MMISILGFGYWGHSPPLKSPQKPPSLRAAFFILNFSRFACYLFAKCSGESITTDA